MKVLPYVRNIPGVAMIALNKTLPNDTRSSEKPVSTYDTLMGKGHKALSTALDVVIPTGCMQRTVHRNISSDNPIHIVLISERELVPRHMIISAYTIIDQLIGSVRARISRSKHGAQISPEEYLSIIHQEMFGSKKLRFMESDLLAKGLGSPYPYCDCDTTSLIFLAIAHELKLPIKMIVTPRHAFVAWDHGKNVYTFFETSVGKTFSPHAFAKFMGTHLQAIVDPHNPTSLKRFCAFLKASTFLSRNQFDKSLSLCNEHITASLDNPFFLILRANIYKQIRKYDLALQDYSRVVKKHPNEALFYAYISSTYTLMNDPKNAAIYQHKANTLSPNGFLLQEHQNALSNPILDPRSALLRLKNTPFLTLSNQVNFARSLLQTEHASEGLVLLNGLIDEDPYCDEAYCALAEHFLSKNNYSLAEQHISKALHFNPYNINAYILLKNLYVFQNKLDRALNIIEKALELEPYNYLVYMHRADIFSQQGDTARALKDSEKALSIHPYDPTNLYYASFIYSRAQQHGRARELTLKNIKYNPSSVFANISYMSTLQADNDLEQLQKISLSFIKNNPTQFIGYYFHGYSLFARDRYRECLPYLNKAIQHYHPGLGNFTSNVLYHLRADAYVQLKMYREARKDVSKLLKLDPDHAKGRLLKIFLQDKY